MTASEASLTVLRREFKEWCENKGMLVVSIRSYNSRKFTGFKAFLCNFYDICTNKGPERANIVSLNIESGTVHFCNTENAIENWIWVEDYK